MPKKPMRYNSDEYESDPELHTVSTLISRNQVPTQQKQKKKEAENKKKNKQKSKKNTSNKSTPRKRAQSAPPNRSGRTGHDLWITAVKNRQTPSLATYRRPESPRHKTATEYWVDTLRKTGTGISTESSATLNSFSGLKRPNENIMAYLSTSTYMRQMAGTEKPRKYDNPTMKPPSGTPAYRSQEEYYEQVLELKKQIKSLNQEISALKAKVRRTEEDNIKKEKEIGGLLDPTKNEEMRRTMGEKRPESGAVIQSLKQKILRLENQIKDKETGYAKLQADLKTTKVEEMRVQLEMCFQEIVRLQNAKDIGMENTVRSGKENNAKVKALNQTLIRLNKQNEELQTENRALREDLNRQIDSKDKKLSGDYEDMNRKQLLGAIRELEKRLEKSKRTGDTDSITSYEADRKSKRPVSGKIELEGSVEDRLDQLDKRETELLEELDKQKKLVKRLKEEKTANKQRNEEYEKLVKDLQSEIDYLNERAGITSTRRATTPRRSPRSSRPPSGRRLSLESSTSEDRRRKRREEDEKIEEFRKNQAAKRVQRGWKSHKQNQEARELEEQAELHRRTVAARRIQRGWKNRQQKDDLDKEIEKKDKAAGIIQNRWRKRQLEQEKEHAEKVEQFRQNRAAKKIQNQWTGYKYRKHEEEVDDAAVTIASALRGHQTRKSNMKRFMTDYDDYDDESESEGYNDAVDLIQSSVKGHYNRKKKIKSYRPESDDEEVLYGRSLSSSARGRPSSALSNHSRTSFGSRKSSGNVFGERPSSRPSSRAGSRGNYESHDDDDDIQF